MGVELSERRGWCAWYGYVLSCRIEGGWRAVGLGEGSPYKPEWEAISVCRRAVLARLAEDGKLLSSLLSDWTRGLVGGL